MVHPGGITVDETGIDADAPTDVQVDVDFDGRRVWSFWLPRDGEPRGGDRYHLDWPHDLRRFLDGVADLRVRLDGDTVGFEQEVRFGTEDRRITITDGHGRPLGIDNSGRLTTTFSTRAPDQLAALLGSLETVLAALESAGVAAFPAYGTLLGAVREGTFIGHDSDADVGYVSRFTEAVDVIRESFRLQRELTAQGFAVTRYSGAAFRVDVEEGDGTIRGLDVFGGFFHDDHLTLMGEIFQPFEREWMLPLGTTTLAGATMPAPAQPEKLLEAMYGPSWRRPDPAFKFGTPPEVSDRLDAWFRGTRTYRNGWDRRYAQVRNQPLLRDPHDLARHVHEHADPEHTVVDVGCGRGRDAVWLARRGRQVLGLDYSHVAWQRVESELVGDLPVRFGSLNLLDTRSVLAWGARLARDERPRVLMARHTLDATTPRGRANLFRLCSMALRGGGTLHTEMITDPVPDGGEGPPLIEPVDVEAMAATAERHGGTVVAREELVGQPIDEGHGEALSKKGAWRSTRLSIQWR